MRMKSEVHPPQNSGREGDGKQVCGGLRIPAEEDHPQVDEGCFRVLETGCGILIYKCRRI